jgi:SM-20-related protein
MRRQRREQSIMLLDQFFTAVGFHVERGFLHPDECARLRAEARDAPAQDANVVSGPDVVVDLDYRRTRRAELRLETESTLGSRFEALIPRVAKTLDVKISRMQQVQLLVYRPGDFFAVHPDNSERTGVPDFLRERSVSVLVFLGHEGVPQGEDAGGDFLFHELLPGQRAKQRAFAVAPEPGKLIAFPARTLHEVRPVLHGVRYSLVTWFC